MSKTVSFKNNDRFIQIGIAIVTLRKLRGMSQEKLAEKAGISRSLLSVIEAPKRPERHTTSRWMCSSILRMHWKLILPISSARL